MAQSLKYYFDLLSQPSRAMYIILKLSKTPFESVSIALRKGEHFSDEYKNINRFQKVPCIDDNGFKLSESVAILRYLNGSGRISNQLYPTDAKVRARVDEYLEWQHHNTRAACALYFQEKWLKPLLSGKEADPKKINNLLKTMDATLNMIENIWLDENKYIASNSLTVADVFAACELEQPTMCGYDPTENRPKLKAWLKQVKNECNPVYDEAHKYVYKIAGDNATKAKL